MSQVIEATRQGSQLNAALKPGVESISSNQTVTFVKYIKLVLPLDKYIFWVRADRVSTGALLNAARFNAFVLNSPSVVVTPAPTLVARGSLHYATEKRQDETETYSMNRIVFTAEDEVQDLNQIGPSVLFLAEVGGVRFAFSQRGSYYEAAKLYYYVGSAVYSDMDTQIVDDPNSFDRRNVIVSNSLPIWLAMNSYAPTWPIPWPAPSIPFYPSFLVPPNLPPPYASIHIEGTEAIGAAPAFSRTLTHTQLTKERVRVTLYGARNYNALDLIDFVGQYTLDNPTIMGVSNQPIAVDEKRTQVELGTIAMKKTIVFDCNYYQTRVADVARQLILSCVPDVIFAT